MPVIRYFDKRTGQQVGPAITVSGTVTQDPCNVTPNGMLMVGNGTNMRVIELKQQSATVVKTIAMASAIDGVGFFHDELAMDDEDMLMPQGFNGIFAHCAP